MYQKLINKIIKHIAPLRKQFFYIYSYEGRHLSSMLIHNIAKGYPERQGSMNHTIIPTNEDKIITDRLIKAYKKASKNVNNKLVEHDIWDVLKKEFYTDFIKLLEEENVDKVSYMLCNMAQLDISEGLVQGTSIYKKIMKYPTYRRWQILSIVDKLVALAEALYVLPYENPEQGEYGRNIFYDPSELVEKIEHHLKISIIPPPIEGGLYTLITNRGNLHARDLTSLYTALRCKEILQSINVKVPHICEIGGGIGKGAYYAYLLGLTHYTIIDLPYINVLQGYYLIKSLPTSNIYLYGEDRNDKNPGISILPNTISSELPKDSFTLTLNQDSFPEIDREVMITYLREIKRNTTNFLLSVNQESSNTMLVNKKNQNVVPMVISKVGGYQRIYRIPYQLREGYVEELYKIIK